jgi:DNA-nicking Smr family endonuclease
MRAAPPLPKLPDRPLSAAELFAFAVEQLPRDLRPYDLKFGSGSEAPRLPDIDDAADQKAAALTQQPAAAPAHLTPAQRAALREATRLRELQAAFDQEMNDAGVRRVSPSKRADLQTPTIPSVADLLAKPIEPARPSLSRGALAAPDLLDQLHDPTDPANALAIPPNFTHTQRRLLERAQRRDGSIPEVSLRGLTLAEAMPALQTFLAEQRAAGARTVRVITGKGHQSEGAPVLKGAVEGFLLGAGAHLITAFAPEITRDGDYGAFAVQLRR